MQPSFKRARSSSSIWVLADRIFDSPLLSRRKFVYFLKNRVGAIHQKLTDSSVTDDLLLGPDGTAPCNPGPLPPAWVGRNYRDPKKHTRQFRVCRRACSGIYRRHVGVAEIPIQAFGDLGSRPPADRSEEEVEAIRTDSVATTKQEICPNVLCKSNRRNVLWVILQPLAVRRS